MSVRLPPPGPPPRRPFLHNRSSPQVPIVVWLIVAVAALPVLAFATTAAVAVVGAATVVVAMHRMLTDAVITHTVHPNCPAPGAYPGQNQDDDYCADRSGRVILRGVHITATGLRPGAGRTTCAAVTYRSHHDKPLPITVGDWQLRTPEGTLLPHRAGTLRPRSLAAGAHLKATVCFTTSPVPGRHVLTVDPKGWDRFRGVWFLTHSTTPTPPAT
ncbi:hypothetical protein GCM10010124_25460 [Pilimelia terevasa]|uniref:DUF4352 domain-containing protein n=1 Tax=Pilimelia terevasa TaxID=53372 RepID=A0A8J3BQT5_9ACTN|nr:hypothetical protein [Pilimelia terevasa]GGK31563.1 hypothetical protein GCM10010124_25460 [Pilimelia terevasa]